MIRSSLIALPIPESGKLCTGCQRACDTILFAGAEAHICIFQTVMGALQSGFHPWIVADAISSREKRNAKLAIHRMRDLGMTVGPAEMAIYELLHKAGTPAFKAMLPHLK